MRCALTRWAVSTASDRRRPLPGWAARHIGRCDVCRVRAEQLFAVEAALADGGAEGAPAPRLPARRLAPAWAVVAGMAGVAAAALVIFALAGGGRSMTATRADRQHAIAPPTARAARGAAPGARIASTAGADRTGALWSLSAADLSSLPSPLATEAHRLASDADHGLHRALAVTSFR